MVKIIASLITCLIVITAFADDHGHGPDGDKAMHDIETSLFLLAQSKKATIHVTFDAADENAVIIYSENRKNKIWEIKNYGSDKKKVESGSFSLPKNSSKSTMGYIISAWHKRHGPGFGPWQQSAKQEFVNERDYLRVGFRDSKSIEGAYDDALVICKLER